MDLKKLFGIGRQEEETVEKPSVLKKECIRLGMESTDKDDAIRLAGKLLVLGGYVEESYIEAMLKRESDLSTYIGNGVAIPHGVNAAKASIKSTGISVLQFPNGVDFGEGTAYLVIGIAGVGKEHLGILSNLATIMEDETVVEALRMTTDVDYVYGQLTDGMKE